MSSSIYPKLALTNLKNNRKTYVPYVLTATLTVMMYYIMDALSLNKSLGEGKVSQVLRTAVPVIIVFAIIFLFYTNSFLIKRRKKEIGVYNILGMEKRHIAKMLSLETFITAFISITGGILGGIVFSKLMFLILLKVLKYDVRMEFSLTLRPVIDTLILCAIIFLLTLIYNFMQIQLSNPIELLHGSAQGEKEPRTKWLLTLIGLIAIGIGYYIAVTTDKPLEAITLFFVAVICVIIGTYALFTAGSIALLKMLRKNKKYYYKTSHFTSVSGMIYRMKQNAVGLANICILSTMVLVMISTSSSLYMGIDDILKYRYPNEVQIKNYQSTEESIQKVNQIIEEETHNAGVSVKNKLDYRGGYLSAFREGSSFKLTEGGNYSATDVCEVTMLALDDYNEMEGKNVSLGKDEVLIYNPEEAYGEKSINIEGESFRIEEELKNLKIEPKNNSRVVPGYYIVFDSMEQVKHFLGIAYKDMDADKQWLQNNSEVTYQSSFDLKGDEEACKKAEESIKAALEAVLPISFESRAAGKESFYMLYGGLLFIGIYLGIMFLMATVLIIYYKQISEGFDDKERYHIMQKVGMSKKEVRRSIKSQILTVFFLPLAAAIIHIAFSFNVVTKLLAALNLANVKLFVICNVISIIVFAVFYAIIYAITAREYYKIVN